MENNVNNSPRAERRREATRNEIQAAAWEQVARDGAAGLSLRAVAAAIGLSAPALYRYFPSKDALVTALIVDAFGSLAAAQTRVLQQGGGTWQQVLRRLGQAYRAWALATPSAFFMIFGDPMPGYSAPLAEVMPAAAASLQPLTLAVERAWSEGDLRLPLDPAPTPALDDALRAWAAASHPTHPDVLYLAFSIASRVQGLMLIELGRQLPPFFVDGADLFDRELERMIRDLETTRSVR